MHVDPKNQFNSVKIESESLNHTESLPNELLSEIFSYLSESLDSLHLVSRRWSEIYPDLSSLRKQLLTLYSKSEVPVHLEENRYEWAKNEIVRLCERCEKIPKFIETKNRGKKLYKNKNPLHLLIYLKEWENVYNLEIFYSKLTKEEFQEKVSYLELYNDEKLKYLRAQIGTMPLSEITELSFTNYYSGDCYNGPLPPLLTCLPPEIGLLTNLKTLAIWKNLITSLPKEIGDLPHLQSLDVSCIQLTSLPPELGKLSKLKALIVSDNHLNHLPSEIGRLTELRCLLLSNNQLESLPMEIHKLKKLINFNIDYNPLTEVDSSILDTDIVEINQCYPLIYHVKTNIESKRL